jgi:hypothetical protein
VLRIAARDPQPFAPHERFDERDVARARAHERIAHRELRAHLPLGVRSAMDLAIGAKLERLAQRARVASIRLHALRPRGVHRREAGIGDNDGMGQRLEMAGDPLALGRRLKENACRWSPAKDGGEPLATRDDATLDQFPVVGDDAQLALAFVEIDPYAIHGWPPGWFCGIDRVYACGA